METTNKTIVEEITTHLKEFPTHKYCKECECCIECECCECDNKSDEEAEDKQDKCCGCENMFYWRELNYSSDDKGTLYCDDCMPNSDDEESDDE